MKKRTRIVRNPPAYDPEALELWHPDEGLNEVRSEALASIPAGSRVTVGNTDYTRVFRGWLEQEYDTHKVGYPAEGPKK